MPAWVLLLARDSVRAAGIEQEIRLGGFSPRRAPDVDRARVLLETAEPPAAVVVDVGGGTPGLGGLAHLAKGAPVIALTDAAGAALPPDLSAAGAAAVVAEPGRGELARKLTHLAAR
ncbi:MAG: hypothetical protein D6718_00140 [Acidobacteria bacterium]|nr:MAG: hypothetical protein D6718_00140 [Acidobacteriota bacterium]